MNRNAADVVLEFIDCINAHDVAKLSTLMSEDLLLVDGLGQQTRGRKQVQKGWRAYFSWFPDYTIEVYDAVSRGELVSVFGSAEGTYSVRGKLLPENRWKIPSAWRAIVRDGCIAEWQVYADNEPIWKVMRAKRY
jgi:ketosteroid isomerase-like protein